ncbi:MAG: glycosyltransferase family 2 protein [Muribaculaceae bacterium]|nr:glycosyltransferase family 2 protein [Muribaculaceae bacterium]
MERVSVIIPVYNVERYLPRCLESVIGQTYRELEIIVVDDGSTDGSGALCDQWAARDPRIRVIHKPNGGLSSARNAALDAMTGSCVFMLDSDDWLPADAIESLYLLLVRERADVAVGSWREVREDSSMPTATSTRSTVRRYTRDEALSAIFYQHRLTHSPCARLHRATLFDGLRYPVGMLYEDLAVAYPLYSRVATVVQSSRVCYNYLQRATSILGTFKRERTHVLDILEALERQVACDEPALLPAVRSRRLSACFNILLLCPAGDEWSDVRQRCWRGITELRGGCLRDRHVRFKNRLGILASLLGQRTLMAVGRRFYT